jgi:hypothetical protein
MRRQVWSISLVVLALSCLSGYLLFRVHAQEEQITSMTRKLLMLRALAPGRARSEVVAWMGEPQGTRTLSPARGKGPTEVLIYKSSLRRTMNGLEDVWVVLDSTAHVAAVYYPDYELDARLVDRLLREPPLRQGEE